MATLISGEELIGLAVVDATHPKLYMGYIYMDYIRPSDSDSTTERSLVQRSC